MAEAPAPAPPTASFLATPRGKLTLAFLCVIALLDFLDTSVVNVALPSIQRDLHFSQQGLQWVLSGYVVSYGGFLLLGGRLADLLGRRRILVAGTALFGVASLAGGSAQDAAMLVGARLAQGIGAALMSPAGLSLLTTSFSYGTDRVKALSAWGGMAAVAAVAGVVLGGLLSAAIATARTNALAAAHAARPDALAGGYSRALLAGAFFVLAAALIATRAANTRGEPTEEIIQADSTEADIAR